MSTLHEICLPTRKSMNLTPVKSHSKYVKWPFSVFHELFCLSLSYTIAVFYCLTSKTSNFKQQSLEFNDFNRLTEYLTIVLT